MIKINKETLKELMAIADANNCLYVWKDVIKQLKNDNDFDGDTVSNFINEVNKRTDKIMEEDKELLDFLTKFN